MKLLLALVVTALGVLGQHNGSVTDYAPITDVECPNIAQTAFIRQFSTNNQSVPAAETAYIKTREQVTAQAWKDWLKDGSSIGYDLTKFEGKFPRAGLAIPGGGLRSAQFGAAFMNALDIRNDTAKAAGTGGLLQVLSYITGLSGVSSSSFYQFCISFC
jgi:lysophospholipase